MILMLCIIPRGECLQWWAGSGVTWCEVRVTGFGVRGTGYGVRGAGVLTTLTLSFFRPPSFK